MKDHILRNLQTGWCVYNSDIKYEQLDHEELLSVLKAFGLYLLYEEKLQDEFKPRSNIIGLYHTKPSLKQQRTDWREMILLMIAHC